MEIGIRIDQTLTQDATGTLVMLELESIGLDRARTELSCQYVDHNLIQEDYKNRVDHLFLLSACQRFGIWFSRILVLYLDTTSPTCCTCDPAIPMG
jgi:aconitate hydratase